jgi:magnesium-transporting ATPase (P-type)
MISAGKLGFFAIITALMTFLCFRIMPSEFREKKFESLGKKIIHAAAATILIMIFSFQVLPVTDFLTPGTPLQSLFAPAEYFFWWLLLPLAILFIL